MLATCHGKLNRSPLTSLGSEIPPGYAHAPRAYPGTPNFRRLQITHIISEMDQMIGVQECDRPSAG